VNGAPASISSASEPFSSSAVVYDLLYAAAGKNYEAEADELHTLIHARCPDARSLLDVACGTGAHLQHLQTRYQVAGIDAAPAMLDVARQRLPGVSLTEADMRSFDLGRTFDAVTCLFSAIGYMRTTDELDEAVATLARHLSPGGVLVVDGWIRPESWRDPGIVQSLSGGTNDIVAARVARSYREGDHTTLELHHLVGTINGIDHIVESHDLTLFADDAYRAAFARAGLEVDAVASPHPERDRYVGLMPR